MERCPKSKGECSQRGTKLGCHIVKHHIFYPASDYTTPLEKAFRELDSNRVPMCKGEEIELHADPLNIPPKPTEGVMRYCVEHVKLRQSLGLK